MLRMEERLLKLEDKSLDQKFSIDKLMSVSKGHSDSMWKNGKNMEKIQTEIKVLSETKQDLFEYQEQRCTILK